jgi:membrane protein DedA with SNARE-associated domain
MEELLQHYGAIAVFVGTLIEGEVSVTTGGVLAHKGLVSWAAVVFAGATGSFLSGQGFFLAGRYFGATAPVQRIIARPAFAHASVLLVHHPIASIIAFRFLYGLRVLIPVALGSGRSSATTFMTLNAFTAIIWSMIYSTAGYFCSHGVNWLFGELRIIEHILLIIAVAGLLFWGISRFLHRHVASRAGTIAPAEAVAKATG